MLAHITGWPRAELLEMSCEELLADLAAAIDAGICSRP